MRRLFWRKTAALMANRYSLPALLTLAERGGPSCYQILLYHRVNDTQDPFFAGTPTRVFQRHMYMLREYFTVLPLAELVERAQHDQVPPKAVAVTFDDGYGDNYDYAFPVLKQLGLPATIFLATGAMESRMVLWHDRVFAVFRRTRVAALTIDGKEYGVRTLTEKRQALHDFLRLVWEVEVEERERLIADLTETAEVTAVPPVVERMLSWGEVEKMARHHISFGAHTETHPILTRMPISAAAGEVLASKACLEEQLQMPVKLFAYPNGRPADFNAAIKRVLAEAGFLCAVTTVTGANSAATDPFELRRIGIWENNARLFALRLGWHKVRTRAAAAA